MEHQIQDYPQLKWVIALVLNVLCNVLPMLFSFFSFYKERDNFFQNPPNFRNQATEKYEKEKLKREPNSQQTNNAEHKNETIMQDTNVNQQNGVKYNYENYLKRDNEKNNIIQENNNNNTNNENLNSNNRLETNNYQTSGIANDLRKIDEYENEMLNKYKRTIKCEFIVTIAVLLLDCYSNIDTFINLKPRFQETNFVLYNNSYLINNNSLIFDDNSIYNKTLKFNSIIENEENNFTKLIYNYNNNPNKKRRISLSFLSKENESIKKFNKRYKQDQNNNKINVLKRENIEKKYRVLIEKNDKNQTILVKNITQYSKITLKPNFNFSKCKSYFKKDLEKIEFIYDYSKIRYALLIINCFLDLLNVFLIYIGFINKVQMNKFYKSTFIVILLFFLNKCWSMFSVAYSYFDFDNDCLNSIEYFDLFFYVYLCYVFLLFSLLVTLFIYSLFCRQLLYFILIMIIYTFTLFIPVCIDSSKLQTCLEKIFINQEKKLVDDLEDVKNLKFNRDIQKIQLYLAYLVFSLVILTGVLALVNFGILKYIWIKNSIRTIVPAFGSIISLLLSLIKGCFK